MRELPPTAGLPLQLSDLRPGRAPFATRMAEWLGVDALQLTCSGTAALVLTLHAMHTLRPNRSEVVVPAWTCPLVALAIHHLGLKTRPCDLAPNHYDMDAAQLAAACGPDTLAIVPTHIAGRVADVQTALRIARSAGAFVIEDAAQSLGAKQDGRNVGLLGDASFFSLAVGKGLTLFEGGLLYARDAELREALSASEQALIHPSPHMAWQRAVELLGYWACYRPRLLPFAYGRPLRKALTAGDPVAAVGDDFGFNIPLHPVSSWRQTVGTRALKRFPAFLQRTRAQAQQRVMRLRQLSGITVFDDPPGSEGTWPFLLLTLPSQAMRDAAMRTLWTSGLGVTRLFIHALPDYDYLRDVVGPAEVPNARNFAARSLSITNSPWLKDAEFERIYAELERVLT